MCLQDWPCVCTSNQHYYKESRSMQTLGLWFLIEHSNFELYRVIFTSTFPYSNTDISKKLFTSLFQVHLNRNVQSICALSIILFYASGLHFFRFREFSMFHLHIFIGQHFFIMHTTGLIIMLSIPNCDWSGSYWKANFLAVIFFLFNLMSWDKLKFPSLYDTVSSYRVFPFVFWK